MQSLLRTRPENLDDLTVQVALVRPGPIQGKAVHPYIERRQRLRDDPSFVYPVEHESLPRAAARDARRRRLPGPGARRRDGRRRVQRRRGRRAAPGDEPQAQRGGDRGVPAPLRRGLRSANGIDEPTAHAIYDKLVGFSGFGFPKSHAAAFGLLAYQSAWLRRYYPAEFLCSLLNAQPMGFYPPASLVRDAQRRGVEVRPPHVNLSAARCTVETGRRPDRPRLRPLGRGERKPRRSPPSSPTPTSATSPAAAAAGTGRARGARRLRRLRRVGAEARAPLAPRASTPRGETRHGRRRAASSRSRSSRPPRPRSSAADRLGADARRLPPHLASRSACTRCSSCARICRRRASRATSWPGSRTARASRSPASPSPASAPRPRRASSSCCSRTSTAR